jgi:hypothetical protein
MLKNFVAQIQILLVVGSPDFEEIQVVGDTIQDSTIQ